MESNAAERDGKVPQNQKSASKMESQHFMFTRKEIGTHLVDTIEDIYEKTS